MITLRGASHRKKMRNQCECVGAGGGLVTLNPYHTTEPTSQPTQPPTHVPDNPSNHPTNESTIQQLKSPIHPTSQQINPPASKSTSYLPKQSTGHQINHPTNQSTGHQINQLYPTNQSISRQTNLLVNRPIYPPTKRTNHPTNPSTHQPTNQSTTQIYQPGRVPTNQELNHWPSMQNLNPLYHS